MICATGTPPPTTILPVQQTYAIYAIYAIDQTLNPTTSQRAGSFKPSEKVTCLPT